MNMTNAQLLGLIPVLIILGIGSHLRRSIPEDQRAARWFRILLITLICLLTILTILMPVENRLASYFGVLLTPATSGVFALIIVHLFSDSAIWSGNKSKTIILLLIPIALLILMGTIGDVSLPLWTALSGAFVALIWWSWNRIGKKYLLVGAIQILLLGISLWAADANYELFESPRWLSTIVHILIFFFPAFYMAVAGHLVFDLVSGYSSQKIPRLLFGSVLILFTVFILGYQMYLSSIWDVATDGLGAPFLEMQVAMVSLAVAMILVWYLPGWRKLAAFAFAILIPLSMRYPNWLGTYGLDGQWGKSPIQITERRAEKINRAIQNYHEDHQTYPNSLLDLIPLEMIYIPQPMIIPKQTWCYEGGQDFYRLGYIHRQYFSSPASVRIHISSGEPPDEYWPCEGEAAKYPGFLSNQEP